MRKHCGNEIRPVRSKGGKADRGRGAEVKRREGGR